MNQLITYKQDNGTVAIIQPTEEALATMTLAQIAVKDVPAGVSYKIVNDSDIPSDRTFRNAWKDDLTVDMPKAQVITKDRLRAERKPLLQALDVAQLRNLADPVALANIESKKQVLRDATKQVDSLTTLDELKAAQLPVL